MLDLLAVPRPGDQGLGDSQDDGWLEQLLGCIEHPRDAEELLGHRRIGFRGGQDGIHVGVDDPR